jgi:hypothetical protein
MLVACRLAGLSALEADYAGDNLGAESEPTQRSSQGVVGKDGNGPPAPWPAPPQGRAGMRWRFPLW